MKTTVIYDSVFGNTEKVSQAIGKALSAEVYRVGDVKADVLTGVEFLLVGSPTRAFRATEAIRKFLQRLPANRLKGVKVAAFDTRMRIEEINSPVLNFMVPIFGFAAKPMADGLIKKGGELAAPPEGFFVAGGEGPLKEGELERAAEWARRMHQALQGR
jgi:flavodoxin